MLLFSQIGSFMVPGFGDRNHKIAAFVEKWNHMGSIKLPSKTMLHPGSLQRVNDINDHWMAPAAATQGAVLSACCFRLPKINAWTSTMTCSWEILASGSAKEAAFCCIHSEYACASKVLRVRTAGSGACSCVVEMRCVWRFLTGWFAPKALRRQRSPWRPLNR